jgi:hypothetical protein
VAVDFEARGLARRLRRIGFGRSGSLIRTVGLGCARLADVAPDALALRPAAILVTGLAGGCAPDLRPGDVVVGRLVGPSEGGEWIAPEPELADRAEETLKALGLAYRVGPLCTAPEVAATVEAKARLWRVRGAVAVDMESFPVVAWARRVGLPALAVRGVADGPGDVVPPALSKAVTPGGGLRIGAAAQWLREPALIRAAWQLWRRSGLALDHLAQFVAAFRF